MSSTQDDFFRVEDDDYGFAPYPNELAKDSTVSLAAKGLYAAYGSFVSWDRPTAWPTVSTLCAMCGIHLQTLRKYKKELVKSGWISERRIKNEKGVYGPFIIKRHKNKVLPSDENFVPGPVTKISTVEKVVTKTTIKNTNNNNTRKGARVLPVEVSEYIEGEIAKLKRAGELKSEGGLRYRLIKLYESGELVIPVPPDPPAKNDRCTALRQVDEWERECGQHRTKQMG